VDRSRLDQPEIVFAARKPFDKMRELCMTARRQRLKEGFRSIVPDHRREQTATRIKDTRVPPWCWFAGAASTLAGWFGGAGTPPLRPAGRLLWG
jgi:hypothetical protein